MMEVEIRVDLTLRDFFRFQVTSTIRQCTVWMFIAFAVSGISYLKVYFSGENEISYLLMGVFFMGVLLFFPYLWFWISRTQKRQTVAFNRPITYRISEEALSVESHHGTVVIPWADVFSRTEDKHAFYVYISSMQGYILPKRCFTREQGRETRRILKSSVREKKYITLRIFVILLSVGLLFFSLLTLVLGNR